MKSNYKKLGSFIVEKGEPNKELNTTNLLGINNAKFFVKAKTNLNGIDLSKYRIVERNQFAFNRATTRNGNKISIAIRNGDTCIVSPSYRIFEIKNVKKLEPQYLMMWFRRPEFDRYARFRSHGSAHEFFDYDEMCDVDLPVPSIGKQREIVREYNVVNERIALNEQLTKILEYTAQTIYKQWFVDFEFPISKEYAESISKPELEGQPYKSSGGEMKYCEELECEVPIVTNTKKLEDLTTTNSDNINLKKEEFEELLYLDTGSITDNHIEGYQVLTIGKDKIPSRAKRKVKHNSIVYSNIRPNLRHYGLIKNPPDNLVVSTGFCVINSKSELISNELLLLLLSSKRVIDEFQSKGEMSVSTYPSIKPEDILETLLPVPNRYFNVGLNKLNQQLTLIYEHIDLISREKIKLLELSNLIEKNIINRL